MTDQTFTTDTSLNDVPTIARPTPLAPHRLDLLALLFGLGFIAIGIGAIADGLDWVSITGRAWGGAMLITVGVVSVVALAAQVLRATGEREHP